MCLVAYLPVASCSTEGLQQLTQRHRMLLLTAPGLRDAREAREPVRTAAILRHAVIGVLRGGDGRDARGGVVVSRCHVPVMCTHCAGQSAIVKQFDASLAETEK